MKGPTMSAPYPPPHYPQQGNAPYIPIPGMTGPPKRSRRWPWVVLGVVIVLMFGACAVGGNRSNGTTTYAPRSTAAATAAPEPQGEPPAPAASSTGGPATSFGQGVYVVGEDIVPGKYKSAGAEEGIFDVCLVTTYAGDTPDSKVIALQTANAHEPMRVNVSGSVKSVQSTGCTTFTKV